MRKIFSPPLMVRWSCMNVSYKITLILLLEVCIQIPVIAGGLYGMHHYGAVFRYWDFVFWGSLFLLMMVLLTTITYTLLYRIIIKPIRILSDTMNAIHEGHYDIEYLIDSRDELGGCAETMVTLAHTIRDMVHDRELQAKIMRTMYKVLVTITDTAQDEQALLNKILYEIHAILQYDAATICVYRDEHTLVLTNRVGDTDDCCIGTCIDMNPLCAAAQVVQKRAPVLLKHPNAQLPCCHNSSDTLKSWLGVPIIMNDEVIGVVALEHRSHIYSNDNIVLLQAVASQIAAVLTHYRYVDKLQQTNQTLQQERRMFVDGAVIVFKWHNEEGWPVEYVSPNVVETFGYTDNEFMTRHIMYAKLIPIEDLGRVSEEIEQALDENRQHFEHSPYRIIAKDGDHKWLYDFTTIIRDEHGTPTHFLGYVLDITEQRQAEALLQRLKQAIETVEVGVTITDRDGNIIYTNPAEATMHGYSCPDDLFGKPANLLGDPKLRNVQTRKEINAQESHIPDTHENFMRESRNIQRDGTVFPVYLISSRIYNERGEFIGTITVSENISKRKQVERQLKHQNQELSMMTKALSHDLMNPARGLEGMSEILVDEYAKRLGEDGQQICKLINQYAVRMARMIEASRQHARAAEQMDLMPISSLSPIQWAIDQLNSILDHVEINIPHNSYVIQADLMQLGRVFQNLFENAVKFSNTETPKITITQIPQGRMLEFQVADNGIGIAPRYQKKIFHLFHQIDPKGAPVQEGTGVGLAIVKKIVEKHGGSIRILSAAASPDSTRTGTTFSFTIPLSTPHKTGTDSLQEKTVQKEPYVL